MNETTRQLIETPLTGEELAWIEAKRKRLAEPVKPEERLSAEEPRFGKVMSRYTLPRSTTRRMR